MDNSNMNINQSNGSSGMNISTTVQNNEYDLSTPIANMSFQQLQLQSQTDTEPNTPRIVSFDLLQANPSLLPFGNSSGNSSGFDNLQDTQGDMMLPPPPPPPPPFQPMLSRQYSAYDPAFDNYVNSDHDYRQSTSMSKIELIKGPLETFLSATKNVAPLSKVTLVAYDDMPHVTTGTIDEIISAVRNLHTGGSTNFISMIKEVRKIMDEISATNSTNATEEKYTPYLFVLTDGHHNHGGPIEQLTNDASIKGLFNLTLGIGSTYDVQSDLLQHLSGDNEDGNHISSNAVEIEDLINGGCFEGVISLGMRNVVFDAVFETDSDKEDSTDICVLGEESRTLMSKSDLSDYLSKLNVDESGKTVTNNIAICKEVCESHYVLVPINAESSTKIDTNSANKFLNTRTHFIIALDRSGSMADFVRLDQYGTSVNFHSGAGIGGGIGGVPVNASWAGASAIQCQNATLTPSESESESALVDTVETFQEKSHKRRKIIDKPDSDSDSESELGPSYVKISFKTMTSFTQASAMIMRGKLSHLIVHYQDHSKKTRSEVVHINHHNTSVPSHSLKPYVMQDLELEEESNVSVKPKPVSVFKSEAKSIDPDDKSADPDAKSADPDAESKLIKQYAILMKGLDDIKKIPKLRHNFKDIKAKIQLLHNDNLGFLTAIDDPEKNGIEPWLIQQCKSLWGQIESRYRSTLTKGEQFVEFAEVTPSALCRAVSATISATKSASSSMSARQVTDSTGLCKICYCNPVNMVFTNCKHAGTCTNCVITHIDLNGSFTNDYECPFCKIKVSSYVQLNTVQPYCECGKLVSYYGDCRHPLGCYCCMKHIKNPVTNEEKFKCQHCSTETGVDKYVKAMKIHYA
jgi:hypothetical protein